MKITPTSLTVNQLLSSTSEQFFIPSYQRRYSWRERQIRELIDDIDQVEETDTHLLGSIVCLTGNHTAGLNKLELVDGQQRLTTMIILLHCIRERLTADGTVDSASGLTRLLTAKARGQPTKSKLKLESIDAQEFKQLANHKDETKECEFVNGNLVSAFAIAREWTVDLDNDELETFLYKLENQAFVVHLDVNDAKDAFKLFETINNRGLKLNPTDIVKNFVLGNAARLGEQQLERARKGWAKLITHLDGTDTDAFFRYFLISCLKQPVTRTEVVTEFKKMFMNEVREASKLPDQRHYSDSDDADTDDPELGISNGDAQSTEKRPKKISFKRFLNRLVANAKAYGELILAKTGDLRIDNHLKNLQMIKAAQTYGFLMHLRVGDIDDKKFIKVLKLTESFILRRHICRERANETETLFAKLCSVNAQNPVLETKKKYRDACPTDEKFRDEFENTLFSSSIIGRARYCLEKIELAKHGKYSEFKVLGSDSVHVEHIIPQKIKTKRAVKEFGDWVSYLGKKAEQSHPKYVARIGNLTLFAGELNISASNNPFANKKKAYAQSGILMTTELSKRKSFKFRQVDLRSTELAKLAVDLWPIP